MKHRGPWVPLLLALAAWLPAAATPPSAIPAGNGAETLDYGLFGTLHLRRPEGAPGPVVVLVSDRDGWTARQDRLADGFAKQGAFVVGISLPAYLKRMESINDKCAYPAAHFEEVAHWVERHENMPTYRTPLVVGDGAGASFAYAMTAQAPAGTFEGLVTLGWDATPRYPKLFCAGDAGAMTVADDGGFRVAPVARFPSAWRPLPFASGARRSGVLADFDAAWHALGQLVPQWAPADSELDPAVAYARWHDRPAAPSLPDDVADLPLTEVPPKAGMAADTAPRIAVMLTGDGGWAGLDRGVADALSTHGLRVIGFSTLKFFWQKQTPESAAQAVARVLAHYGSDPRTRFVLIGYSFGASLVPVVVNRLPPSLRARVLGGVMISPDDEAVFEIHVGDWIGSTRHDDALPIAPEVATAVPLVCVHGADEDDSYCLKPQPPGVRVVSLAGGHHYEGAYDMLGNAIVANLPSASSSR